MEENFDLTLQLHEKIIRTLGMDIDTMDTHLSNEIFLRCEDLNDKINDLVQEEIFDIEEEFNLDEPLQNEE